MKSLTNIFSNKISVALIAALSMTFAASCSDDDDDDDNNFNNAVITNDVEKVTSNSVDIAFSADAQFGTIDGEEYAEIYAELYYIVKDTLDKYGLTLKELIENSEEDYWDKGKEWPEKYSAPWASVRYGSEPYSETNKTLKYNISALDPNTEYVYVFYYEVNDYSRLSEKELKRFDEIEEQIDILEMTHSVTNAKQVEGLIDEIEKLDKKALVASGVTSDATFTTTEK